MAGKKRKSVSKKAHYTSYQATSRKEANRARKLAKHIKSHPNDRQAVAATGHVKPFRRKAGSAPRSVKPAGLMQDENNLWKYVADSAYLPGHPVLNMLKKANYSRSFRYNAIWKRK